MESYHEDIEKIIMEETSLILVAVIAEGCMEHETGLESHLNPLLDENKIPLRTLRVCFDENNLPWPRPITEALYYFVPKRTTPLFLRVGQEAVDRFFDDLEIATKMMSGMSYEEAIFDEEELKLIKETEQAFSDENEDISKYPSKMNMVRNLGRDLWKSAKYVGKRLPVLASKEIVVERYSICEQCPNLTEEGRCTECGCYMTRKVNLAAASCPIDKWDSTN
jgi:hypothetical protein